MEEFKKPEFLPKTSSKFFEEDSEIQKNCNSTKTFVSATSPKLEEEESKIENIPHSTNSAPNLSTGRNGCSYIEPNWSGKPIKQNIEYKFEVLKSGSILEEIRNLQTKSYWVIGRLEENDIAMAHPTISRFHAVFQYRPDIENTKLADVGQEENPNKIDSGWYIYDLGSTHGTFLNKMRVPPKTYIRMHVGHMLKFGASLRSYILQGPGYDEEPESEFTVTELKERKKQENELKAKQEQMQEEQREKEGITWGMTEDADEETDLSINPYATTNNEELFLDDPKKTLRGFFEREGLNLDYKCDEMSPGTFVCRVDLPLDDANGKQITAEVCHKGKKKDCVVQCALEACRILDRHGVLRQSHHEPLKRKAPKADSDDDDDFLDRTGDIQRKKLRKATAGQSVTLTYEDLIKQENELHVKFKEVEGEIALYQENCKRLKEVNSELDDDLDNYMENLAKKSVSVDKTEIRRLRVEEQQLRLEIQKVKKLIKIAKPFDLPPLNHSSKNNTSNEKKTTSLPLFGKRNKFKFVIEKSPAVKAQSTKELKSDEEEFDDDDESSDNNVQKDENKETDSKEKLDINFEKESETIIGDGANSNNENRKDDEQSNSKLYGPAVIPQKMLELNSISDIEEYAVQNNSNAINDILNNKNTNESSADNDNQHITESVSKKELLDVGKNAIENEEQSNYKQNFDDKEIGNTNQSSKKRKHRTRNRQLRENVDIDDYEEFVDAQKHSEWIPPKNQSGDGRTSLNDKFGY